MHRAIVFSIKGPSWRMREHDALETASRSIDNDPDDEPYDNQRRRR
jgi:hypothetical protein